MVPHTILKCAIFYLSIWFVFAGNRFQTTHDDDTPPHRFPSCRASSYCTPIRRCTPFRDGWKRSGVGITCGYGWGPYRMVCCPIVFEEDVPVHPLRRSTSTTTTTAVPPPKSEATYDDDTPPHKFPSCRASSYCTPIGRCPPFRDGWKRSGVGITCGYGSGPYRMVCCPIVFEEDVPVHPLSRSTSTTTTTAVPPPKSKECGLIHEIDWSEEHATEDSDAQEATWPWMVVITSRNSRGLFVPLCSGFLIDRTHVVTAAHCFPQSDRKKERFATRIGSDDVDAAEEYPILEMKQHEDYRDGLFYYDIAILTLAREVNITNFAPICLPDDRLARMDLTGMGTTVLGWGSERHGGPLGSTLKQLDNVPVVNNKECNQIISEILNGFTFERQFPRGITGDMMCLGQTEGGRDACGGDSGGPVMMLYKKRWFAIGFTSFGYRCNIPGVPGGYTRISSFLDWIIQNSSNPSSTRSLADDWPHVFKRRSGRRVNLRAERRRVGGIFWMGHIGRRERTTNRPIPD